MSCVSSSGRSERLQGVSLCIEIDLTSDLGHFLDADIHVYTKHIDIDMQDENDSHTHLQ